MKKILKMRSTLGIITDLNVNRYIKIKKRKRGTSYEEDNDYT